MGWEIQSDSFRTQDNTKEEPGSENDSGAGIDGLGSSS